MIIQRQPRKGRPEKGESVSKKSLRNKLLLDAKDPLGSLDSKGLELADVPDALPGSNAAPLPENPLVTIVMPVYNVADFLDDSLRCATSQTYSNLEIIPVDDGSPDNSGAIMDDWAARDSRIHPIHQENGGLSAARNAGIAAAHGDCIYFYDPDDLIENTLVETCLNAMRTYAADVILFKFIAVDEENTPLVTHYLHNHYRKLQVLSPSEALKEQLRMRIGGYAWSYMARTSIFRDNGITFPIGRKIEDLARICQVLGSATRVVRLPDKLYRYRLRTDSIMTHPSAQMAADWAKAMEERHDYVVSSYPKLKAYAMMQQVSPANLDYESLRQSLMAGLKLDPSSASKREKKRQEKKALRQAQRKEKVQAWKEANGFATDDSSDGTGDGSDGDGNISADNTSQPITADND